MRITWDDSLLVGHPRIDAQHKMLVDILNHFTEAFDAPREERDSRIRNAFASISLFTELHFNMEERLMREASYPDTERHVAGHRMVLEGISRVNDMFADPEFRPEGLVIEADFWASLACCKDSDDLRLARFLLDPQRLV